MQGARCDVRGATGRKETKSVTVETSYLENLISIRQQHFEEMLSCMVGLQQQITQTQAQAMEVQHKRFQSVKLKSCENEALV